MTEARTRAQQASSPAEAAQAEGILSQALGRLFAVAERIRTSKATQNFQELQAQLSDTENKVAVSRQVYNDTVLTYHNAIRPFPSRCSQGRSASRNASSSRSRTKRNGTHRRRLLSAQVRNPRTRIRSREDP